jgi:hypothetical protein
VLLERAKERSASALLKDMAYSIYPVETYYGRNQLLEVHWAEKPERIWIQVSLCRMN